MKIFIPPIGENWINDRLAYEFAERTKHEVVSRWMTADLVWSITPSLVRNYGKPQVLTIAHIVPSKYQDLSEFYNKNTSQEIDKYVTHYTCYSDFTIDFIKEKNITQKEITKIPYWINTSLFYPIPNLKDEKYLTIGSFQRDTEGRDLISPKLEKGPDVFLEVVNAIKDTHQNIRVMLTGHRRQYVITGLEKMGVPYQYHEFCDFTKLNELYNMCDYYLVTSRCEGGPQAILEAAQTKCNILATNVGVAKDILDKECVCYNVNDFVGKIKTRVDKTKENYDNVQHYEMKKIIKYYDEFFESCLK